MAKNRAWEDDQMCFACGSKNPIGLGMQFFPIAENGLESRITLDKRYQGFKDVVHGGLLALLLDEVMVNFSWIRHQVVVVTAAFEMRLHHPAPVGKMLVVQAFSCESRHWRFVPMRGEIRLEDGTLIATAKAKCMKTK